MENTPHEIGKYDTYKKMVPYKNSTLCEKMTKDYLPSVELSDFRKWIYQICCMIQTHGLGISKSSFSSLSLGDGSNSENQ